MTTVRITQGPLRGVTLETRRRGPVARLQGVLRRVRRPAARHVRVVIPPSPGDAA